MSSRICFYWLQKLLCIVPKIKSPSTAFLSLVLWILYVAGSKRAIKSESLFNGWLYKRRICVPVSVCWGTTPHPNDKEFGEVWLYLHTLCFLNFFLNFQVLRAGGKKRFSVVFSLQDKCSPNFSWVSSRLRWIIDQIRTIAAVTCFIHLLKFYRLLFLKRKIRSNFLLELLNHPVRRMLFWPSPGISVLRQQGPLKGVPVTLLPFLFSLRPCLD